MKKLLYILFFFFSFTCIAQDATQNIKKQAEQRGDYLIKKNYTAFLEFTHPGVVKISGGKERLMEATQQAEKDAVAKGITRESVFIGEPSKMVNFKNTLQCVISQTIQLKTPQGTKQVNSALIGVSFNKGSNWYFIDASGKSLADLKKVVEDLSDELVLP